MGKSTILSQCDNIGRSTANLKKDNTNLLQF